MKEYQEWLNKIILILNTLCEGIVPAGRPDEAIYWNTRALYEKPTVSEAELAQYCADGLTLLEELESDWHWRRSKVNCGNKNAVSGESSFLFRRKYARQIAGSLQMLVNFAYLLEKQEGTLDITLESPNLREQMESLFEIDTREEVRRVHAGVRIAVRNEEISKPYTVQGYRRAM